VRVHPRTDNLVNGTYSCENERSLTDHLKGRLNFSGWVVSDWGADHGSVGSLNAGMDQTMSGGFNNVTEQSILGGAVPASRVDDALRRILTKLFEVGVFDRDDYGVPCARGNSSCSNDVRSAASNALNKQFAVVRALFHHPIGAHINYPPHVHSRSSCRHMGCGCRL
jgi:beta-glucosidase